MVAVRPRDTVRSAAARIAGLAAIAIGLGLVGWSVWPAICSRVLVRRMAEAPRDQVAAYQARILLMGRSATGALEGGLRDRNMRTRRSCAWLLGEIGDPAAAASLANALRDSESSVRWRAAEALGKMRAQECGQELIQALADSQPQVRAQAAWALGRTGDPATFAALTPLRNDRDPFVRRDVLWALARTGGPMSVPFLLAAREDPHPLVRAMAVRLLAEFIPQAERAPPRSGGTTPRPGTRAES